MGVIVLVYVLVYVIVYGFILPSNFFQLCQQINLFYSNRFIMCMFLNVQLNKKISKH